MKKSIITLEPYNPGKPLHEMQEELGKPLIQLSANESLWGPAPRVIDTLKEKMDKLHFYPDGSASRLKASLSELWGIGQDYFCLGNGTDELIFMLTAAFLNPNDEVIIPSPTFSEYKTAVTIAGGVSRLVHQPQLSLDLSLLLGEVSDQTKLIFLCNPNNPTGTAFTHAELEGLLASIKEDVLVILDEAYCHYAENDFPRSKELIPKYPNLIVLRTFSKLYGLAALRVGYAVAAPQLISQLEKVRQPFNVDTLAQAAAVVALEEEAYYQKVIEETNIIKAWFAARLEELGYKSKPSAANFVLVNLGEDAPNVAAKLKAEGILIRHTASFGLPEWVRISIGPRAYMEELLSRLAHCKFS